MRPGSRRRFGACCYADPVEFTRAGFAMIYQLLVPGPIEDVEELRVLEWHGTIGQDFVAGAMIVELETHKAVVEVRAAQEGVLRAILCEAGGWERIGKPLALFSDRADEPLPDDADAIGPLAVRFEIT